MDSKKEYDYLLKLLLVGNADTGKSSILLRFSDDVFSTAYLTTIGVDFKIKNIDVNNKKVKLQVWDTAGQERFQTIASSYYRGSHGIIIVYNVTDRQSFTDISKWVTQIKTFGAEDVVTVLVGNKCDCNDRQVSFDEGQAYADSLGMKFFETSAKDHMNIEKPFTSIVEDLLKRMEKPTPEKHQDSSISRKETPSSRSAGKISSLKAGTSFKDLYLDNTFADVFVEVEGEQIHCHKVILAKGCKFFYNLFTSEMKDSTSKTIKLEGVKAQTFKVLIAYLYAVDNIEIDENTAFDLVGLADKYLLPDLRKECEKALCGFLTADNFLKYVSLSETMGEFRESFLNEVVVKFILKNYESVKDRDDFYKLPKDIMRKVVSDLKPK